MRPIYFRGRLPVLGFAAILTVLSLDRAQSRAEFREANPSLGRTIPQLASFDRMMVAFLEKYQLPGAALAVARGSQLVYERGFGCADRETGQLAPPGALFRIASVSKPFTAVAILQLVERGKLHLDDKVFDVLGLAALRSSDHPFDERWQKVTIRHLLHQAGGWDRDKSFDPMFRSTEIVGELQTKPPAGPWDIIRFMLRRPLQFEPGERYAYSNFGYCLLGRVIDKISGSRYEDYVRREVLAPLGIHRMRIGHTLPNERAPDEVRYYVGPKALAPAVLGPERGRPVPKPYGSWSLEAMDSHGGWIASAADLVRFASAFDDPEKCKILSARSVAHMFAPPPGILGHRANGKVKNSYYACGWSVRPLPGGNFNAWHGGALDGCSSLLVRRHDHLTWAVLFNSRNTGGKGDPAGLIDPLMHKAADEVTAWPGQ